jgi:hypothetical protein|tara:strand:+ start:158 stop:319 length:162 start_codon:yes stop_codon:yes gene_type:complete
MSIWKWIFGGDSEPKASTAVTAKSTTISAPKKTKKTTKKKTTKKKTRGRPRKK